MSGLTIICVRTQILVSQPLVFLSHHRKNLNFMLKAQIALATSYFFNQLGHVGVVTPPPPPKVTSKDVQVRMWTTGTYMYVLIKLLAKQTLKAFKVEYLLNS